ncbi:hypothetical protein GCM10027447_21930 [Glycomyces halotolerans]
MTHLGVAAFGRAGQIEVEAPRTADRVAADIDPPGGEMVVVGIDAYAAVGSSGFQGHRAAPVPFPRRSEVPHLAVRVESDAIRDRSTGQYPFAPLPAAVGEGDGAGQHVAASRGVGQMSQRAGQVEFHSAAIIDPNAVVAEGPTGFPVGGQEQPCRSPAEAPLVLGHPAASR